MRYITGPNGRPIFEGQYTRQGLGALGIAQPFLSPRLTPADTLPDVLVPVPQPSVCITGCAWNANANGCTCRTANNTEIPCTGCSRPLYAPPIPQDIVDTCSNLAEGRSKKDETPKGSAVTDKGTYYECCVFNQGTIARGDTVETFRANRGDCFSRDK